MESAGHRFTILIGRIPIGIESLYGVIYEQCQDYETNQEAKSIIRSEAYISRNDFLKQKNQRLQKIEINNSIYCITQEGKEAQEIQRKIIEMMIGKGFLIMHGAAVAKDGEAYIFTAPSGTGKTTRLRFWMELYPDSVIINGDKPMICVTGPRLLACGTPWAGKEGWNSTIQVPIRAIFLLERAEQDSVEEISIAEALLTLIRQTYIEQTPEEDMKRIQMLKLMEGKVHFFRYRSTMTAESVRMAYEAAQAAGPIQ